ncbi:MAG: dihydrofolate reductase, partial [Firmicutes bacterium]|nr:dihydrofolate reductase [Bacillota bacterium]
MNLIAAAALDWGIGYKGDLLAKIPEDMRYVRQKTIGNVVVMGRKTLESFPGGEPLPNRLNIVLSASQKGENAENLIWVKDLDELFETLEAYDTENVF